MVGTYSTAYVSLQIFEGSRSFWRVFYGAFVNPGRMKPSSMPKPVAKLNHAWITHTHRCFLESLRVSDFPEVQRNGVRRSVFEYPESLIMLIAVLSVKCKEKTYLGTHRMACRYWSVITPGVTREVR
jgi:hypothetical protein